MHKIMLDMQIVHGRLRQCSAIVIVPIMLLAARPFGYNLDRQVGLLSVDASETFDSKSLVQHIREHGRLVDAYWRLFEDRKFAAAPTDVGDVITFKTDPPRGSDAAIALYTGHDASVALAQHGRVQCVLELERLFEVRSYGPPSHWSEFHMIWQKTLQVVRDRCECDNGHECPTRFGHGVIVSTPSAVPDAVAQLPLIVDEVFTVDQWHLVQHHVAHAALGYYASPFRSALVLSYDGGGDDSPFNAYIGSGLELTLLAGVPINLGNPYEMFAELFPEVSGGSFGASHSVYHNTLCNMSAEWALVLQDAANATWIELNKDPVKVNLAGTLMGYSGLGKPRSNFISLARSIFQRLIPVCCPIELLRIICGSVEDQRDLAASIEVAFEQIVHDIVVELLQYLGNQPIEGIVFSGGCAHNVLTNQAIYDAFTKASGNVSILRQGKFPLDLYVPPAGNDGGLAVGGLWAVRPPLTRQPLQYLGFRLWDLEDLDSIALQRGALQLASLGGVPYLAKLLVGRVTWPNETASQKGKPIIAVVRGRSEFGPRALGHRSLLAVPDSNEIRDRLNRLKARQFYRPVAPMIAEEALTHVFGRDVKSTYMSMAPRVRDEVVDQFPALAHFDGTARHQSVSLQDEPWLHQLLLEVGKMIGLAALINTSFNSKGKPIVNHVSTCLQMLDELPDLDYVLIEGWLFRSPRK